MGKFFFLNEIYTIFIVIICICAINEVSTAKMQDKQPPVHIQADKMVASPKNQFIVFKGNVRVTQEKIQLTADTLNVYMVSSEKTVSLTKESVQKIDASGHVKIHFNEYRIEADTAIYLPPKNKLVVSGNKARLYQRNNKIAGSTIILNLETEEIEISSKKGEQVEAIYEFSNKDMKNLQQQNINP
jgi:lipopolysaccharide transport protein LptA